MSHDLVFHRSSRVITFAIFGVVQGAIGADADDQSDRDDAPIPLAALTVSTERDYGYRSSNSISATRTNTPIKDVPLNIQVFTPEFMKDLGIKNQIELYSYNAALVDGGRDLHSDNTILPSEQIVFRGFGYRWGLRDGIREYDAVDTQNLARVEIVKGPAAALYGLTLPGGVIQSVTKAVDFGRTFTDVRFTVGNYDDYRATLDTNRSFTLGGSNFGVRINSAYEKSRDERAHSAGKVDLIATALAWRLRPSTQLEFLAERGYREKPNGLGYFTRPEFPNAFGLESLNYAAVPLQVVHPEIPWTWNWSNGKNMRSLETHLYRGTITQNVGADFEIRGYWQFSDRQNSDADGWGAYGDPGAITFLQQLGWNTGWVTNPATHEERIQSAYYQQDWSNSMHAYGVTGVYRFDFAGTRHTFAFGASVWGEREIGVGRLEDSPTYLVFPVRADIPVSVPSIPPPGLSPSIGLHQNNSNDTLFLNWQGSWLKDRLKTNVGLSHTNFKLVNYPTSWAPEGQEFAQSRTSPLVGSVFSLTRDLSVFVLHAASLFPDATIDSHLRHFPPIVAKSLEGGFKFDATSGLVSGTLSFYRILHSGGAQFDPAAVNATPGLVGDFVRGGEQESKGCELDFVFQPIRSWQIVVSYAHNQQQITKSAQLYTIGQSNLEHVANRFAVVSKYTSTEGSTKGFYLGVGASGGSKALKDYIEWPANSGQFVARYEPGRTVIDLFGGRQFLLDRKKVSVQLNVKNLTQVPDYVGWKATNSPAILATERYRAPTRTAYRLTVETNF